MAIFNDVLKISFIGTLALIPYIASIEGYTMPEQTKNSTFGDETAMGTERRQERREDRQERRDDRRGYDENSGQTSETAMGMGMGTERRQERRDDRREGRQERRDDRREGRQERRDDRRGYDGQSMPSTQMPN